MAAPLLQAEIDINAPVSKVWEHAAVETRHAENGVTAFSNMSINAWMGGVPSFERELVDGMNATLSRIKAAAER
jgi:hypothetical protein